MTFTFYSPPTLTKEQASPWQGALTNALDTYAKTKKLSYLPRQMEADLFAKEIGPLAGLASSPNFRGFNPEIQKMIAQHIGGYLGHGQGGESSSAETPGYADDKDIYGRIKKGADVALSSGGKSKVGGSRLAGEAEKLGLPKAIVNALGGSEAAGQNAAFEQAIAEGVKQLTLKGYSPQAAQQILTPHPGETNKAYIARVRPLFVEKQNENESNNESDQNGTQSEEHNADAEATAKAFNTTPEKVKEALKMGVKTKKEFKEFLKWSQQ